MNNSLLDSLFEDVINMAESENNSLGLWREKPLGLVDFFTEMLGEKPFPGRQTELLEIVEQILDKDNLPEGHKLKQVTEVAAMWGKGCLLGSSTLFDANGRLWTIKELAEEEKCVEVTCVDPKTHKLTTSLASPPSKIGRTEMFRVTLDSGKEIVVTAEHVFMTRTDTGKSRKGTFKGVKWLRLADLKAGDYIATPSTIKFNGGIKLDPREARLIGYWLGDGSFSCEGGYGNFLCSNKEVERDYCDILLSYGVNPSYPYSRNEKRADRNCKVISHAKPLGQSRKEGNKVNEIAKKYGFVNVNAYNKRIPWEVMSGDEETIINFLEALYATDGWVTVYNGGRTVEIGYCTVNKDLALDLQNLLLKIGVVSRVSKKKTDSNFGVAYQVRIRSKEYVKKFNSKVHIVGKHGAQVVLDEVLDNYGEIRKDDDIYWDRIKSIESVGEDDYYDLSVLDYGNYVANGIINHNSGKDFIISGIVAYIPYRLNCMNNPQEYFGFGKGEPIDIINLAKNAKQAENVFFTKLKARLASCKWFKKVDRPPVAYNEYQEKKDTIVFYNNIRAFSGHSEAGSFEGFNPLVAIFDEVGDFERNLAEFCYDTLRSSAMSRFGKRALLLFISFPRSASDFMVYKYNQGQNDNEPEVISSRGASWEVNLNIKREDLEMDYRKDPEGAKMRFECIPPAQKGGFFQYPERIDDCVKAGKQNPCVLEEITITHLLDNGEERHFVGYDVALFKETLELDTSKTYYIGLDGGITNDSYTLSLFHGETFYEEVVEGGDVVEKARNKPVEDLLIEWKPDTVHKIPVSVQNVIDIVEAICERVYVKSALMDKFNSGAMVQKLMEFGVEAEDKVFSNPFQLVIYTNFKNLAYTGHLELLDNETANEDMKSILLVNGSKIDHDKDHSKDTCDARTAAVYLCANDDPEEITNWSMPTIAGAVRR